MKKGMYVHFDSLLSLQNKFMLVKVAGFDSVILGYSPQTISEEVRLAHFYGLEIANVHLPIKNVNILWSPDAEGDAYVDDIIDSIHKCGSLGIKTGVFHITSKTDALPPNGIGLNRLKRMLNVCEKYNFDLALENLRMPGHLNYIFENISHPNLKFCYDTGHNFCFTPSTDYFPKYADKLAAVHLQDNHGINDIHLIPGDGQVDFKKAMKDIKNSSYKGPITLESHRDISPQYFEMSPALFARKCFEAAYKLERMMEQAPLINEETKEN